MPGGVRWEKPLRVRQACFLFWFVHRRKFPDSSPDMVKHSPVLMARFFTPERFGRPQVLASCLLLVFLAQCLWLVERGTARRAWIRKSTVWNAGWRSGIAEWLAGRLDLAADLDQKDVNATESGSFLLRAELRTDGYDASFAPVVSDRRGPAVAQPGPAASLKTSSSALAGGVALFVFGLLLGASLWYVARRLFGNAGGYIALALYCFSPGIVRSSALWFAEPEVGPPGEHSAQFSPPSP